jgi:hypothetical protein
MIINEFRFRSKSQKLNFVFENYEEVNVKFRLFSSSYICVFLLSGLAMTLVALKRAKTGKLTGVPLLPHFWVSCILNGLITLRPFFVFRQMHYSGYLGLISFYWIISSSVLLPICLKKSEIKFYKGYLAIGTVLAILMGFDLRFYPFIFVISLIGFVLDAVATGNQKINGKIKVNLGYFLAAAAAQFLALYYVYYSQSNFGFHPTNKRDKTVWLVTYMSGTVLALVIYICLCNYKGNHQNQTSSNENGGDSDPKGEVVEVVSERKQFAVWEQAEAVKGELANITGKMRKEEEGKKEEADDELTADQSEEVQVEHIDDIEDIEDELRDSRDEEFFKRSGGQNNAN